MQNVETPKKQAQRSSAKPSDIPDNPNEKCRFCPFKFSVRYGQFGKPSWENLFKISGKQEFKDTATLAQFCEDLGFAIKKSPVLSERICKPCGRSLRRTHSFYLQLKRALEEEINEKFAECSERRQKVQSPVRTKRTLPTTISPERTSLQKQRVENPKQRSSAKKMLSFSGQPQAVVDHSLSALSINELVNKTTTQIKVVIVNPNQVVETKLSISEESKCLNLKI